MIVLVLGGIRSGKSEVAERLATGWGRPVTYVATAQPIEDDLDFAARIAAHRARRPPQWTLVEAGADLPEVLAAVAPTDVVLVDSLGTWLAGIDGFDVDPTALLNACDRRAPTVLVSDEVGLSVHPPTEIGRRFADALGGLNRSVADAADHVVLVVAGRAVLADTSATMLERLVGDG